MGRAMQVSDHVDIALDAECDLEAGPDPAQMPRWSPENTGATVPEEHRPMRAGETFEGTNLRGRARWVTESVVTSSVPGRRFAFHVRRIGVRRPQVGGSIATWVYDFDEIPGGTRVTETWIDGRVAWPRLDGSPLRSCRHRRDDLRGLPAGEHQAHAQHDAVGAGGEREAVVATPLPLAQGSLVFRHPLQSGTEEWHGHHAHQSHESAASPPGCSTSSSGRAIASRTRSGCS